MFKKEISEFIKSLSLQHDIMGSPEILDGIFIDYYLPALNRALLFHAIEEAANDQKWALHRITHSDQIIQIIHVWEDQWRFQRKKVESRILSMLGITKRIHGRETEIITIDNDQLVNFLDENHMNVPIKAKYKYGLKKNQELVAVMSFSKGRPMIRNNEAFNSFELLRFCNKLNLTVVGGFSKLLNHFIKKFNPDDIMTYVDADWSDGQSFLSNGFKLMETMPLMEFWLNIQTGEREYPHLALKKLKKTMDIHMSETEKNSFLHKHGYTEVYNSGSYKYIFMRK